MPETNTIKEARVCKTCAFTRIDDGKVVCVLHCCPVRAIDSCEDWKAYASNSAAGPWQTGEPAKDGKYLHLVVISTEFGPINEIEMYKYNVKLGWHFKGFSISKPDYWAEINLPKPNAAATAKCP